MVDNFKAAIARLQSEYPDKQIIPVNGCSYGKDGSPYKKRKKDGYEYWKFCGQDFWSFVSGNEQLYTEIIKPLGHQAKIRNDDFNDAYSRVINLSTLDFAKKYCTSNGAIDWNLIVRLVSERHEGSPR